MPDFAAFHLFSSVVFHALLTEHERELYKKATHHNRAHHKEHSKLVKCTQIAT